MSGNSCRHGPHQVAQKLTSSSLPVGFARSFFRSSAEAISRGTGSASIFFRFHRGGSGAGGNEEIRRDFSQHDRAIEIRQRVSLLSSGRAAKEPGDSAAGGHAVGDG